MNTGKYIFAQLIEKETWKNGDSDHCVNPDGGSDRTGYHLVYGSVGEFEIRQNKEQNRLHS